MRTLAIDWSGARSGAARRIWLAEAVDGRLTRLECGRSREEIVDHLIDERRRDGDMVVGLDFAFSFPAWYVGAVGAADAPALWHRTAAEGEDWMARCEAPFWGRPGRGKPDLEEHFRGTEREAWKVTGAQPKSVFQIGGAGAVGTGSIRGMPALARLSDAGFAIWPFDPVGGSMVIEIYPRLLTGAVVKSDPAARSDYLQRTFPDMAPEHREAAASSEDALDAAVSALVMARHVDGIRRLPPSRGRVESLEGRIWWPGNGAGALEDGAAAIAELPCPFCETAEDRATLENRAALALEDSQPLAPSHVLVVPRRHVASIFDLPTSELRELWELVARVRRDLQSSTGADGFTIGLDDGAAAGQTVPHAHVHVIPRHEGDIIDPRGGIRCVIAGKAAHRTG